MAPRDRAATRHPVDSECHLLDELPVGDRRCDHPGDRYHVETGGKSYLCDRRAQPALPAVAGDGVADLPARDHGHPSGELSGTSIGDPMAVHHHRRGMGHLPSREHGTDLTGRGEVLHRWEGPLLVATAARLGVGSGLRTGRLHGWWGVPARGIGCPAVPSDEAPEAVAGTLLGGNELVSPSRASIHRISWPGSSNALRSLPWDFARCC